MKKIINALYSKTEMLENIFTVIFLIYAILSNNGLTYGRSIITPFMYASFLLAVLLIGIRVLNCKKYFSMPLTVLSLLMVCSVGISTVLNRNHSFKDNAVFCIYWAIYFLIYVTTDKNKSRESCKKTLRIAGATFTVYTTVAVIASLVMYFAGVSETYIVENSDSSYYLGFVWGRLWGVFLNPNQGSISCAISIMIFIYLIRKSKKLTYKILLCVNIFIHIIYMVFSDSRSGAVALSVAVAAYVFAGMVRNYDKKIGKQVLSGVLAVCVAAACFVGVRQLRKPVNLVITAMDNCIDNNGNSDIGKEEEKNIIDRGYDLSEDVSNRRFDIWKSGLEIFAHSGKNMIFGVSFRGIVDYAKENMPQTYIINNGYSVMRTFENDLLNILVSNGVFGILCTMAFVVYALILVFKNFFKISKEEKYYAGVQLAIILELSVSAMFSAIMFYSFSPNSIIFWILLGQMIAYFNAQEEPKREL